LPADVAAGPGENRHRRDYWWRLVGRPRAQIGRISGRAGHEREAGNTGQQELFHASSGSERSYPLKMYPESRRARAQRDLRPAIFG
jgi:hypothetical protein